jgi:hypothetical protein
MRCSKVLAICVVLFLLAPAFAQRGEGKAKIPFDFQIGNQTLAAGDFRVVTEGVKLQVSRINGPDMATTLRSAFPVTAFSTQHHTFCSTATKTSISSRRHGWVQATEETVCSRHIGNSVSPASSYRVLIRWRWLAKSRSRQLNPEPRSPG